MRQPIRSTALAIAFAVASTGAFALGDKRNKTEPSTQGANSTTGQSLGQGAEKSTQGTQSSGMPTGQGATTADAAKQRGETRSTSKGGTTDDNLGRSRADEKTK